MAVAAAPPPSPKELWEAYPLKPDEAGRIARQASSTPAATATPAPGADGGGSPSAPLLAGAAVLAFTGGLLIGAWRRVPRRRAPAEAAPAPLAPRVPWPADAEMAWRCEITWRSGYRRSEFRAVASAPGSLRGRVLTMSPPFKHLLKDPADVPRPELVRAVRDLVAALEAQGWTPVAPGGRWYGRRFVWTRPDPPPGMEGEAGR